MKPMKNPVFPMRGPTAKLAVALLLIISAAAAGQQLKSNNEADPEFDPAAIALMEKIKKEHLNPRYGFLWPGSGHSQWLGLTWSAERPKRLRALEIPPEDLTIGRDLGPPLTGFPDISGQPALEKLSLPGLICRPGTAFSPGGRPLPPAPAGSGGAVRLDLSDYNERLCPPATLAHLPEILPNLAELNLSGGHFQNRESYRFLSRFKRLRSLNLDRSNFTYLEDLPAIDGLKHLSLRSMADNPPDIKSLAGLELHSLDLSHSGLIKTDGLEELAELRRLKLAGNKIKSFRGSGLKRLEILDLSGNSIETGYKRNLDLGGLGQLKELYLEDNPLPHIEFPHEMPLVKLHLGRVGVFSGLENISGLEELRLNGLAPDNDGGLRPSSRRFLLSGLNPLKNLKRLQIKGLTIDDRLLMEGSADSGQVFPNGLETDQVLMEVPPALEELDLRQCRLYTLKGLPSARVRRLNVSGNWSISCSWRAETAAGSGACQSPAALGINCPDPLN